MVKKQNWKKLASLPPAPASDSEDIELDEDDYEFLNEFGPHSEFLLKFERNLQERKQVYQRLPIKDAHGRLKEGEIVVEDIEEITVNEKSANVGDAKKNNYEQDRDSSEDPIESSQDDEEQSDEDTVTATKDKVKISGKKRSAEPEGETKATKKSKVRNAKDTAITTAESKTGSETTKKSASKKISKLQSISEIQEIIAANATLILEDPQKHLKLLKSFDVFLTDSRPAVQKLGLLSLLQIYIDILPLYKIRKLTEAELEQKLSKDVRVIREYENSLVKYYQAYLQSVERISKTAKSNSNKDLLTTCLYCISQLLIKKPHFNYRLNLMTVLISNLTLKQEFDTSLKLCCDTISEIFRSDEVGESTRDCVKLMSDMIHKQKYVISPMVIDTFLHLNLSNELKRKSEPGAKIKPKKTGHITKRQAKVGKHLQAALEELNQAEATYDSAHILALQSETLKYLFLTYFRILKQPKSNLITSVLEGLSKFAYLINVDFFQDLLTLLKQISTSQTEIYSRSGLGLLRSNLQAITSAFEILDNVAVEIDLREFYVNLYTCLPRLAMQPGIFEKRVSGGRSEVELVMVAIESMIRKREVPVMRIAGFIKRLSTVGLALPANSLLAILGQLKHGLGRFLKLNTMLDGEGRLGCYDALVEDPDLCTPFGTSLWELATLMRHYHPAVANVTRDFCKKRVDFVGVDLSIDRIRKRGSEGFRMYNEGFVVPQVIVPPSLITKVKQIKNNGRLDGPFVGIKSEFMENLEESVKGSDIN